MKFVLLVLAFSNHGVAMQTLGDYGDRLTCETVGSSVKAALESPATWSGSNITVRFSCVGERV